MDPVGERNKHRAFTDLLAIRSVANPTDAPVMTSPHTRGVTGINPEISGAEWWCQLRVQEDGDKKKETIGFHWDKVSGVDDYESYDRTVRIGRRL